MTYVVTAAAISGIVSLLVSIFTLGNIVGAIYFGISNGRLFPIVPKYCQHSYGTGNACQYGYFRIVVGQFGHISHSHNLYGVEYKMRKYTGP